NRGNPNTNDPAWTNFQFTEFADESGNPVTVNVLTTVLYPIFTYQFEPCAPGQKVSKMEKEALEKFLREGAPAKLEFTQRFQLQQSVVAEVGKASVGTITLERGAFRSVIEAGGKNAVVLTVGGVQAPDNADYFVRVFLDKADA